MLTIAALMYVLVGLTACPKTAPHNPSDVMVADAAPVDMDAAPADDCEADCRFWRKQGCPEGNPTAAGVTCEEVCRTTARKGIDTAHQLSCAETATDCNAHRACPY